MAETLQGRIVKQDVSANDLSCGLRHVDACADGLVGWPLLHDDVITSPRSELLTLA